MSENDTVVSREYKTVYYLTNPYSPLGVSGTTGGIAWQAVVTSFTPYPATLSAGSSGAVLSANTQDVDGNVIGGLVETYTVSADGSAALLISIDAASSVNGTPLIEKHRYSITSSGRITLTQIQITVSGTPLTLQ